MTVMEAARKARGQSQEDRSSRRRHQPEGLDFLSWCFLGALVFLFVMIAAFLLVPLFRGK
jgi:hypothetical protein